MDTLRFEIPTIPRLLAVVTLVVTLLWAEPTSAQSPSWTVDEAVERALENPEIEAVLMASIESARAEVDEATVRRTPSLGIDHEQVFGSPRVGYIQTTAMISQTFDFTPWRRRLRESVPYREAALRAETDQWSLEVATEVRLAFYAVRYHEERILATNAWIARLEQGVAVIEKREAGGDVSPYDVRRVARELELAVAARAREQAQLAEAWATLGSWTPWEAQPTLAGALTPNDVPAGDLETLPEIVTLQQRELALDAELDVWGRPFGREWTFGAGARYASQGGDNGYGFMLSLSVPLTFWNTDRPRVERLRAEHDRVEGELAFTRTLAQQAESATRERLEAAFEALGQLPKPETDAELSQLAETAYGAGEGSLLELLDAYESEAEVRLARIDLQWEARRAAIELERRLGIGVAQ